MPTAQETPEVDAVDALAVLVELTRSLLLESMLVLLEELELEELDEPEFEELLEELELELDEPAPGMVNWSPG